MIFRNHNKQNIFLLLVILIAIAISIICANNKKKINMSFDDKHTTENQKSESQNIVYQLDSVSTKLLSLANRHPILIYRFYETNCVSCINDNITILKTLFDEEDERIVLLASYTYDRNIYVFKVQNNIKWIIYNIPFNSFNWLTKYNMNSYYFVLHPNNKLSDLYLAEGIISESSMLYLKKAKNIIHEIVK
jgi:hypothetical protein